MLGRLVLVKKCLVRFEKDPHFPVFLAIAYLEWRQVFTFGVVESLVESPFTASSSAAAKNPFRDS